MAKETLNELRERLLREHHVQQMIQMRAYEIYQMRGGRPGEEAQDWFNAESEVLAFLLADEPPREDDRSQTVAAASAPAPGAPVDSLVARKPKSAPRKKPGDAKADASRKRAAKPASSRKSGQAKAKSSRVSTKSKLEE